MAGTSKPKTDKKPVKYEKIDGKPACPVCSRKFPVHSAVTKHLRTHTGERPYACKHCDSKFTKNSGLKRHVERIHLKMVYACKECNKKFNSPELFSYHKNEHSGKTPYHCKICKTESFSSRVVWMRHLRVIHDVNWKCRACKKYWGENDNFESLQEHIRKGHTLRKKQLDTKKRCETKGEPSKQKRKQNQDVKFKSKPSRYACGECDDTEFNSMQDLVEHLKEHKEETETTLKTEN